MPANPDPVLREEQRARVRADRTDRLLSASAGLVAVSALLVSVYQAYITRQQQRMSAWPYVTQGNTGSDTAYAYQILNVGLGPALVRSMTLSVDGRPMRTWRQTAMTGLRVDSAELSALVGGSRRTTSSVRPGMVLLAGTTTELVRVDGPFAPTLRGLLNDGRVRVRVCYCSLYDECWVSVSGRPAPVAVGRCPDDERAEFES